MGVPGGLIVFLHVLLSLFSFSSSLLCSSALSMFCSLIRGACFCVLHYNEELDVDLHLFSLSPSVLHNKEGYSKSD